MSIGMELTETQNEICKWLYRSDLTRDRLVILTGIPRTTIYESLHRLELLRLVKKYSNNNTGKRGRPKILWSLDKT